MGGGSSRHGKSVFEGVVQEVQEQGLYEEAQWREQPFQSLQEPFHEEGGTSRQGKKVFEGVVQEVQEESWVQEPFQEEIGSSRQGKSVFEGVVQEVQDAPRGT